MPGGRTRERVTKLEAQLSILCLEMTGAFGHQQPAQLWGAGEARSSLQSPEAALKQLAPSPHPEAGL